MYKITKKIGKFGECVILFYTYLIIVEIEKIESFLNLYNCVFIIVVYKYGIGTLFACIYRER
jgi:hypothetical protein